MIIRLHRTNHPEAMIHNGLRLAPYWFEYRGEIWGVEKVKYDGAPFQWEVFNADDVATVRDDYDSLTQVRRQAPEDCDLWLSDKAHEEVLTS